MIPNTDTLGSLAPSGTVTLQPGEVRDFAFIYQVTTARTATSIHAELRDANGNAAGWTVQVRAGQGDWTGVGAAADLNETGTLAPGGTFTLTVRIAAPAGIAEAQTVNLFVASTASTAGGVEIGVAGGEPLVAVTVMPPPIPTPSPTPTTVPTETVIAERSAARAVEASPVAETTSTPTPTAELAIVETPATPVAMASPAAPAPDDEDAASCDAPASVALDSGALYLGDVTAGEPTAVTIRIVVGQPSCLAAPLPVTLAVSSGGGTSFDGAGAIPPDAIIVSAVSVDGADAAWLQPGSAGSLGPGLTVAIVTAPGTGSGVVEVDLVVEVPADAQPGAYSAALTITAAGEDPPP